MTDFTTDNIDRLAARRAANVLMISFRSANAGACHQLYANGRLAAWTETPDQRELTAPAPTGPARLVVAAVDPLLRDLDFASRLTSEQRGDGWVFVAAVVAGPTCRPGDQAVLLAGAVGGELDEAPLDVAELAPAWAAPAGFGQGAMGVGGAGFDAGGPGLGLGSFGDGPMGLDASRIELTAAFDDETPRRLVVRTVWADGQTSDLPEMLFTPAPPPQPPAGISATSYDAGDAIATIATLQ
jgi:hypothetical protein